MHIKLSAHLDKVKQWFVETEGFSLCYPSLYLIWRLSLWRQVYTKPVQFCKGTRRDMLHSIAWNIKPQASDNANQDLSRNRSCLWVGTRTPNNGILRQASRQNGKGGFGCKSLDASLPQTFQHVPSNLLNWARTESAIPLSEQNVRISSLRNQPTSKPSPYLLYDHSESQSRERYEQVPSTLFNRIRIELKSSV